MLDQIEIKTLQKQDIQKLSALQPEGWNDIRDVFSRFIDYDFFYSVKAVYENQIIGIGEIIFNQNSAWIGNVIVDKNLRNQGLGTFITEYLSQVIASKNKTTQLLLATPIGLPVYEKLGFKHLSDYVFLNRKTKEKPLIFKTANENIIPFDSRFLTQIFALDKLAMGEDRSEILRHFTAEALLFVDRKLQGFYLPNLGDGLIIATNHEAGFALLKIKWTTKSELLILPSENLEIINFAKRHGFESYRNAAKMSIGATIEGNQKMIYNRVGGYLG